MMMQAGRDYGTRMMTVKSHYAIRCEALLRRLKAMKTDEVSLRSVNQDKPKLKLK